MTKTKDNLILLQQSLHATFLNLDDILLKQCRMHAINYSASTGVMMLLAAKTLTVGHVGDSRIALGRIQLPKNHSHSGNGSVGVTGNHNGSSSSTGKSILASNFDNNDTSEIDSQSIDQCVGQFLTYDHKPNQPKELRRIEAAGGSLTYLHGGKPFIRGGDFTQRQKKGDRPMQLNYSRAFGAKDLKCFGLSCVPDIAQIELDASVKVVVLASDGLWDVCSADQAVRRALVAHKSGMSREKLPHSLTLSHSHLLTSSLTLSHSHILTHLLSHLLTFSPSHILTHLLTHLLTFSLPLSLSH